MLSKEPSWKRESYAAFRERFFGTPYEVWHDGPQPRNLHLLKGEQREHAIALLKEGLQEQDEAAIVGLDVLDRALTLQLLRPMVKTATRPDFIARMTGYLEAHDQEATSREVEARRAVLRDQVDRAGSFASLHAVMQAGDVPDKDMVDALLRQVADSDSYLVRYHASNSLLKIANKEPDVYKNKRLFRLIIPRVDEQKKDLPSNGEDLARYAQASDYLRKLIARRWPLLKIKQGIDKLIRTARSYED